MTISGNSVDVATNLVNPEDCPNGATLFAFTESGGSLTAGVGTSNRIAYRLVQRCNENRLNWLGNVTPDNVTISDLRFTVTDTECSGAGNDRSPLVTMVIEGEVESFNISDADFVLQTTVTQRLLDI